MRIERGGDPPGSPGDVNGFRARVEATQPMLPCGYGAAQRRRKRRWGAQEIALAVFVALVAFSVAMAWWRLLAH